MSLMTITFLQDHLSVDSIQDHCILSRPCIRWLLSRPLGSFKTIHHLTSFQTTEFFQDHLSVDLYQDNYMLSGSFLRLILSRQLSSFKTIYQLTSFKTIGFSQDHLSVELFQDHMSVDGDKLQVRQHNLPCLQSWLDSLQTSFFKMSKNNARFELGSGICILYKMPTDFTGTYVLSIKIYENAIEIQGGLWPAGRESLQGAPFLPVQVHHASFCCILCKIHAFSFKMHAFFCIFRKMCAFRKTFTPPAG